MNRIKPLVAAAIGLTLCVGAWAAPVEQDVGQLQQAWDVIKYRKPASEQEKLYEQLAQQAADVVKANPGQAEPLIWHGIIVSSLAGARGGLGALGLVKQARAQYEEALKIAPDALAGSAYNSLGVLYYKVPGWPIGFGNKAKAKELLQKALAINPDGIDPNYFYAEYLVETDRAAEAVPFLEKAIAAPPRAGREVADAGRREEARQLLARVRKP